MIKTNCQLLPIIDLPTIECLEDVAFKILSILPEPYQYQAKDIKIVIENYASHDTLKGLNIQDKYELLGLYRGTPLMMKSAFHNGNLPDYIFLYRCPLVRYAIEKRKNLNKLIQQVMFHELNHHFGGAEFVVE